MIPARFGYAAPGSLDEALALLSVAEGEARVLAGGHSLLPMMKLRFAKPSLIVDLRRLASDLAYVRETHGTVTVGALTTHAQIENDEVIARHLPLMADAARQIADPLVRRRGTIGGSLAHGDPSADWPTISLALRAEIEVASTRGRRRLPIDELYIGPYTTTLAADEILVAVRYPALAGRAAGAYVKHARHGRLDFAVVGSAAVIWGTGRSIQTASIALGGVTPTPYRHQPAERLLEGFEPTSDRVAAAAAAVDSHGKTAMRDSHASPEFRIHLARTCARRALAAAVAGLPDESSKR